MLIACASPLERGDSDFESAITSIGVCRDKKHTPDKGFGIFYFLQCPSREGNIGLI